MENEKLNALDQDEQERKFRLERMEKHQREMELLSSEIFKLTLEISDQKESLKELKKDLKEKQNKLLSMAHDGVPDQLTMELLDAPKHCEEVGNPAWWNESVNVLDLPKSVREKVREEFPTCGELCEWLGTDNRRKIKGFGEKFQEMLRDAVDQKAGCFIGQEEPTMKLNSTEEITKKPVNDRFVEKDETEVQFFLEKIEWLLDEGSYDYAEETLQGIHDWVEKNHCYTSKQLFAVNNIENHQSYEDWR